MRGRGKVQRGAFLNLAVEKVRKEIQVLVRQNFHFFQRLGLTDDVHEFVLVMS
jgi:hypothetical protein